MTAFPAVTATAPIADSDWPLFGWVEDVRPGLARARAQGRAVALATLYRVSGSAPRDPGVQMLFDGDAALGYFSGGCVESDVARHAAAICADGEPRLLHYGAGSPWIDIRLRCGGAIHILVERVASDSEPARALLDAAHAREPVLWLSDGRAQQVRSALGSEPVLTAQDEPLRIARRYDPRPRVLVSGWDPTALAVARLAAEAQFETVLIRPDGPERGPPLAGVTYLRCAAPEAIARIGVDRWTAFVGATHDSELDLPACAAALSGGAGYVGLIGAASRVPERTEMIRAAGAPDASLAQLHAPAGIRRLGKAPLPIALGIVAEIMESLGAA